MPTTITIPLTTLTVGNDISTPWESLGTFTSFNFSINRNVGATPVDTLSGNCFTMFVDYSQDGGNTIWGSDSQTIGGGVVPIGHGNNTENTVSQWGTTFPSGINATRARVHPIQTCTVSGSLVLSP